MGYQESYVTSNNKEHFEKLLKKIQSMGKDYYDEYGTWPVEIITFLKEHTNFRKGQQAIYFVGERYLQNELGGRLIGYVDEVFEDLSEDEIDDLIEEEMSYNIIKHYTEDVNPKGIWEDAGAPLFTVHEEFKFDKEYEFPEGTWGFTDLDDYSNEEDYNDDDEVKFLYKFNLKNYPNSFKIINADIEEGLEYFDGDEDPVEVTYYKSYYIDDIKNNVLRLMRICCKDEKVEDMNDIINTVSDKAYNYLVNELNNHDNITVLWVQVSNTTSAYVIVYDRFGEGCLYDADVLYDLLKQWGNYRYRYVKNGKVYRITPEMMRRK